MRAWIRDYGFPALVLADLAGSAYAAATAPLPVAMPDYALQAATVYRLEIAAACFTVMYLAAIAFFLALDGRGLAEFGTRGLKAEQIVRAADDDEQVTLDEQAKVTKGLEATLEDVEAALERAVDEIGDQKQRLDELEMQTIS